MIRRGFTIIEILVGIGIMLTVMVILTSSFQNVRSRHNLQEVAVQIMAMVHGARAKTLAGVGNVQHGIHFESGKVSLFQTATYEAASTTNIDFILAPSVRIGTTTFVGGATNVAFARLTGTPSATGTILVWLTNSTTTNLLITIGDSGASY